MIKENYWDKILDEFSIPHVAFPQDTIQQKKLFAWHVSSLKGEDLLLASVFSFSYSGMIAGITISQIEYFAKNAPRKYKIELANSFLAEYRMKEVFEIGKMMDEDLGSGVAQNQKRVKRIYQYVLDNWDVFQF
jgi:hypothetical protein